MYVKCGDGDKGRGKLLKGGDIGEESKLDINSAQQTNHVLKKMIYL